MRDVRLLSAPFDPGAPGEELAARCPGAGAITTFVGRVRAGGGVEALELQHYAPLTLPGMEALADSALARFGLMGLVLLHRVGRLAPGEPIVCVAAAARHRRAAIEAVDYCMDHLKSAAWFWKREKRGDGWHWIEPRAEDRRDLRRWATG
ncbi:molybdenum cofactor biosynthesis protein MoaE [Pelagerythrobacter marinus]|uniref:molybdenum cofactor biosynthesis protein MoaE n=1 Tax=Pelagerythrobacter marinus TaxID=538382 RepID=UPI002037223E|nr:molybdenum cofactor biosynthesis protein MoaE [Pelagerythrobacter marinus]USA38355.1 molybdenum cofactor biosynthesis protein MoaE [Pelagerythrobacter marinus]WPZ07682.1 molybdenum cofactor biosynthesis protein MoaE [Pelagerythrobacter marinus]